MTTPDTPDTTPPTTAEQPPEPAGLEQPGHSIGLTPPAPPARRIAIPTWALATAAALIVAAIAAASTWALTRGDTPTQTATGDQTTATIAQYAGLVNEQAVDYLGTANKWEDAYCHLQPDPADQLFCNLTAATLGAKANIIVIVLTGSKDPASHTYIGPPPAEIQRLVTSTITDAQTVMDASQALAADLDSYPLTRKLADAVDKLTRTLRRWEPYL